MYHQKGSFLRLKITKIIFRKTMSKNWFHEKKYVHTFFVMGKTFWFVFKALFVICHQVISLSLCILIPPKIKQVIINIPMIYIIKKKKSTIFIILHFHCTETHWNFTGIKIFELILHWILVFILLFLGPNEDGTARAPRDGRFLKKYIEDVLAS